MKVLAILATTVLMALPALADQKPTGIMLMRDSDGIVISVLHPGEYGPWLPGSTNGDVVYMMDGHVVEFDFRGGDGTGITVNNMSGAGGLGPTGMVEGAVYKVEVSGQDVWLRDPVTGILHATERVTALQGKDGALINPNGFALD